MGQGHKMGRNVQILYKCVDNSNNFSRKNILWNIWSGNEKVYDFLLKGVKDTNSNNTEKQQPAFLTEIQYNLSSINKHWIGNKWWSNNKM